MIKSNKEVFDKQHIEEIFKSSIVCRVAFNNFPAPYILPMSYGYHNNKIYLHTANKGLKLELLARNNNVAFEIDNKIEIVHGDYGTTLKYQSIIGEGIIEIIKEDENKQLALKYLIEQHGSKFTRHSERSLAGVTMLVIHITKLTAKANL